MKRNDHSGRLKGRLLALGLAAAAGACALFAPAHEEAALPKAQSGQVRIAAAGHTSGMPSQSTKLTVRQEESRGEMLRRSFFALGSLLKALLSLPLIIAGKFALFLLKKLFTASHPVIALLFGFASRVLMLAAMFALVWKLLSPERPLSMLFKNGRWRWLFAGAALLTAADGLLPLFFPEWRWIRLIVGLAAAVLVTALLYGRLFKGVRAPERAEKWIDIPQTV